MESRGDTAAITLGATGEPARSVAPRELSQRLQWGAAWVVGGRVAGIAVTLLANMVLARQLAPDEFGRFNLLASVIALASSVMMLGLGSAVIRFIPESLALGRTDKARGVLRMSFALVMAAWLAAATVIVLNWSTIAGWLTMPIETNFARLVVASAGLLALVQLTAESLRSYHELRFASLLSGGQTGGLLSNALFLAILVGWGQARPSSLSTALLINVVALAAIAPLAMAMLAGVSRSDAIAPRDDLAPSSRLPLAALLAVCVPMMLVQCVTLLSSQADLWIAGLHCQPHDLALYSAARRLMLLIVMPLQMVNFLVVSSIADLKARGKLAELQSMLQTTSTLAAIPAILGLLLLILGGGPILQIVFGEFYRDAVLPLAILALGQFALAWAGASQSTLLLTGHQNVALAINTCGALLLIVGGSFAAERYGILGLAVTSTVVMTLENATLTILARRLCGVKAHVPFSVSAWKKCLAGLDVTSFVSGRGKSISADRTGDSP